MDSIISTFHLDLRLFIAQLFNFAVVFGVLYFFVFKPLLAVMTERAHKIEQGLADAQSSADKLAKTHLEQAVIIKKAKEEALLIIDKAVEQAELRRAEMLAETRAELGVMINQEKDKMQQEKALVLTQIKAELATLIVKAIAKIMPDKLSADDEKKLIESLAKR
jgi:F-type H+-transporting ATPase subunit b